MIPVFVGFLSYNGEARVVAMDVVLTSIIAFS